MRIFDVVDPGLTILKGRMMQYCNGPRLQLAKMDMKKGDISRAEFMKIAAQAMKNVKMAVKCFEDYHLEEGTSESTSQNNGFAFHIKSSGPQIC